MIDLFSTDALKAAAQSPEYLRDMIWAFLGRRRNIDGKCIGVIRDPGLGDAGPGMPKLFRSRTKNGFWMFPRNEQHGWQEVWSFPDPVVAEATKFAEWCRDQLLEEVNRG